jgi:prevent-host-death family protein
MVVTREVATLTHMAQAVGIRELRQSLSKYVARVKRGEAFSVTERGQEVARLIPAPRYADPVGRLVIERGAVPADGDLLDHGPPLDPPAGAGPRPASDALELERRE